jgi:hypothetical protein
MRRTDPVAAQQQPPTRPAHPTTPPPPTLEALGRASLPLSRVSSHPEDFTEPHLLELSPEGLGSLLGGGDDDGPRRSLEVQVFMSSRGQLAAMAAAGGAALSVLAATWNVGNAMPPPPEALRASWLRGTADEARHHLVAVAAQECSYLKQARASRASTTPPAATPAAALSPEPGAAADTNGGAGLPPAHSLGTAQAAAAAGALQAADAAADEDDEEEFMFGGPAGATAGGAGSGERQGRARMSRAKSLKGIITANIDSATDWVWGRKEGLGTNRQLGTFQGSLPPFVFGASSTAVSSRRRQPPPAPPRVHIRPPGVAYCIHPGPQVLASGLPPHVPDAHPAVCAHGRGAVHQRVSGREAAHGAAKGMPLGRLLQAWWPRTITPGSSRLPVGPLKLLCRRHPSYWRRLT